MSRKHFEALADELAAVRPADNTSDAYGTWADAVQGVADACAASNRAFKRHQFLDACLTRDNYRAVTA